MFDKILIALVTLLLLYDLIDNIIRFKKKTYSTKIFYFIRKDDNEIEKPSNVSKIINVFFIFILMMFNNERLGDIVFFGFFIYSWITINIFNILSYMRDKKRYIINDIIGFNVIMLSLLFLIWLFIF
ncbi:hypothetical protein CLPU_1c02710 [Gottschalkia purinilytica]|uniref:DUF4181 domain-containing protein n=1 Tax=Gottschalkia purinilytica TaxID=1503 RepID=A0A0L0WF96_GOTPU|nr:hypothetical protein CLPU_1c02710 [Gottschalkia purinilytica]